MFKKVVAQFATSWIVLVPAVFILFAGVALNNGTVINAGLVVLAVWLAAVFFLVGFVLPPGVVAIGGVVVGLIALIALFTSASLFIAICGGLVAVGLLLGIAVRLVFDAKQRRRQARLDALPTWEVTELGEVAKDLREGYIRPEETKPVVLKSATAKIAGAVARPLRGSTVIESSNTSRPVIVVYGSRVALVYGPGAGVVTAAADDESREAESSNLAEVVATSLPDGARSEVFEISEGLEPSEPGRIAITSAEPHELALFLGQGAPANKDALVGMAAHIHHKNLVSLSHNGLYAGGM